MNNGLASYLIKSWEWWYW